MKKLSKVLCSLAAVAAVAASTIPMSACSKKQDEIVLRISNWEEYIDEGDWDEAIELNNPYDIDSDGIIGKNSMIDDFTKWFNSTHDYKIRVEYSTFGTNEDLYNRLNLGDVYDLICPSDYLMMQLINTDKEELKLEPFSESFHDTSIETNYYARNVSPLIDGVFKEHGWDEYAAGYMWGTTGIVYNPDIVAEDDVKSWNLLKNKNYERRITIKDNVRDSYFVALGILNADKLLGDISNEERATIMNSTDPETISQAEDILKDIKNNVYSFETDSGKADMITKKIAANFQWSGDAVFIMDEAENDENNSTELWYSIPEECTNLWFDGWVMLKNGIQGDSRRKQAAEAFVNFISRPDNAIRNMYYIGYTSAITGDLIFDYVKYNYDALVAIDEDDVPEELSLCRYDLNYLFNGDDDYFIYLDTSQINDFDTENTPHTTEIIDDIVCTIYTGVNIQNGRQAFAQYPPEEVTSRSVIMLDFGDKLSDINQMWINVRCLDVKDFNITVVIVVIGLILICTAAIVLYKFRYSIFYRRKKDN